MLETVIFIQFLSVLLLVSLRKLENLEIFFFKKKSNYCRFPREISQLRLERIFRG